MSYRFRIYPTVEHEVILRRHCEHSRFIYNLALEQFNMWRPNMFWKRPDKSRQLTEVRAEFEWLREGLYMTQQQALQDFDLACKNWWRGTHGRPTWRKQGENESFRVVRIKTKRLNRKWGAIWIQKCGWVKFRLSRDFALLAECKSARIRLDHAERWHVSFAGPQPSIERTATGKRLGIDAGIVSTWTGSDERRLQAPQMSVEQTQRLHRLQRKLARQQRDSKRREQTRVAIAKLCARDADRRKDWIEKQTTALVKEFDLIAVEDLKIKRMMKSARGTVEKPGANVSQKRGLNRSIGQQCWGTFRGRLERKAAAATAPCQIIAVNPAYTSQRCFACGHTSPENRKSQAVFKCTDCGHEANADVNAARNILAAGLAVAARGGLVAVGTPVKRESNQLLAAENQTLSEKCHSMTICAT